MEEGLYTKTSDYENVDWKKVITILMAYAHRLLSQQNLRIVELNDLAYDFTMGAIISYLERKDKFDPKRNPDLLQYLKFSLLRRIISNYAKSGDNLILKKPTSEESASMEDYIYEFPISEKIDVKNIVEKVQKDIEGDVVMSIIFTARYEENMKRSEICEEFSIDTSTYDNTMKRLKRIVGKHLN